MDFTSDQIKDLRDQTGSTSMNHMDSKLQNNKDTVDRWDRRQLQECLDFPLLLCNEIGVEFASEESFLHIADYHNQFYMSRGGKLYQWLKKQTIEVAPEMIRAFKMSLPWGFKRPDDVERRYNTIRRICK
jgi:hypothetical protein